MNAKQILGIAVLSLPFLAVFGIGLYIDVKNTLFVTGLVLAVLVWALVGTWLIAR